MVKKSILSGEMLYYVFAYIFRFDKACIKAQFPADLH